MIKLYDILQDFATQAKTYIKNKIPTKVSELTNDSGYITSSEASKTYATISYVDNHSSSSTGTSNDLQVTEGDETPKTPNDRGVWLQLNGDISDDSTYEDVNDKKF